MKRFWHLFWIFTLVIMALQLIFQFPELPERIPSHFDFQGNPDGWSSKSSFIIIMIAVIVGINIWYPLIGILVRKIPRSLINIPNKDYWYETPRRMEYMTGILKTMLAMMFSIMNLIFIYLFYYTYQMALELEPVLELWYVFIPILIITVYPIVYLYKRLKIPPQSGLPQ